MSHTLKLKGGEMTMVVFQIMHIKRLRMLTCGLADISLPGLALPAAFATLDSRLESVMQLSMSKGSSEAQVVGLITVCEELKQLLKCAFIGRWFPEVQRNLSFLCDFPHLKLVKCVILRGETHSCSI